MTSVSAAGSSNYLYLSKINGTDKESTEAAASTAASATSSMPATPPAMEFDSDSATSKFSGNMMSMMMSMSDTLASPQLSTTDLVSSMDSDEDGSVTLEEFVASRPDEVSEEDATTLFNSFDSEDTGSLTTEALADAMDASRPAPPMGGPGGPGGPPPGGPPSEDSDGDDDLVSAMDSDEDGSVTLEEFVASRPDEVSEEDATTLFNSFDSEGTGSLTTEALGDAMKSNRPGPPPGGVQMMTLGEDSTYSLSDLLGAISSTTNEVAEADA
ncbi:EF-hand domain-containing protein [Rhizobium sp. PAMB 3182]